MTPPVHVDHLTRRYRGQLALDDVSCVLQPDTITGLLGRNGAGKSTLMRILTGQEFPSSGSVLVDGENPLENDAVLRRMVFVKESQVYPDIKVKRVLEAASWFYPNWDADLAAQLMDDFELPTNRAVKKLSRGMHSAVGIVLGLSARAAITLFDEPVPGSGCCCPADLLRPAAGGLRRASAHHPAVHPSHRRGRRPAGERARDRQGADRRGRRRRRPARPRRDGLGREERGRRLHRGPEGVAPHGDRLAGLRHRRRTAGRPGPGPRSRAGDGAGVLAGAGDSLGTA